jgi:hypothetical protein
MQNNLFAEGTNNAPAMVEHGGLADGWTCETARTRTSQHSGIDKTKSRVNCRTPLHMFVGRVLLRGLANFA